MNEKILDQIRQTAAFLPEPVLRNVAKVFMSSPGRPEEMRSEAMRALNQPQFRECVSDLISVWIDEASDLPSMAVGAALLASAATRRYLDQSELVELLWTGPTSEKIPFRRTDQALIQLIRSARHSVTVVSFAIYRYEPIVEELTRALERGVEARLILESFSESEGKVSFDMLKPALKALPEGVEIYVWPLDKRPKNEAGKHGSLHAKCAVADSHALFISSANLTEYAFSLNMEMGVMIHGGPLPERAKSHFDKLIEAGILSVSQDRHEEAGA